MPTSPRKRRSAPLLNELKSKLRAPADPPPDNPAPAYIHIQAGRPKELVLPHRLTWVGALTRSPVHSPTPYVEALVASLGATASREPQAVKIPLSMLAGLPRTQQPKKRRRDDDPPAAMPEERSSGKLWTIYACFDTPETCIATPEELPALRSLAPPDSPASTPFCILTNRATSSVAIMPCWEIFRYYYAGSVCVTAAIFAFPRWKEETPAEVLTRFDGHRFRRHRVRKNRWGDEAYAIARLAAIGRDACVAQVRTGRAEIRALPPFPGSARLSCAGFQLRLGSFRGLLVRRILDSTSRCDPDRALRWW